MKRIAVALMMFAGTTIAAETSLADAVKAYAATLEWRLVAKDDQCFQPGVVTLAIRTLQYQTARIAELEKQLAERK